jgi:hypothetical protein
MFIASLIREPGRVVSMGRVLVPTLPSFNDLFIYDLKPRRVRMRDTNTGHTVVQLGVF